MDITKDTHAQHQADADKFYHQLEQASPAHIAAIAQEATRSAQLDIIVRDSAQWRHTYSQADADYRVQLAERRSAERDRARYARSKRRHYVTAITRSLLPPPRLGPTRTPQEKQATRWAYWSFAHKTRNPSEHYVRKVAQDADSNYLLWALVHPTGGPVSGEEINAFRAQYLLRGPLVAGRITRNEIRPVGMTSDRALEIAIAALNRNP